VEQKSVDLQESQFQPPLHNITSLAKEQLTAESTTNRTTSIMSGEEQITMNVGVNLPDASAHYYIHRFGLFAKITPGV
jgi:hypothetical protein